MINQKSDKVQRLAIILIIIVVTCIAYQNVLNNRFINFDDTEYVTKNDHVHDGISVETIIWSFKSNDAANWHPLTWMSHALDCSLFGLDAKYHHAMNLLLHLFSSIILFLVIDRMTSARWQSAFVALIFAVHPLHVESVAWIAER
ncbi:MAG: hypothetical protein HY800_09800, partial [Ignavibacteriales bacterium]|nr:hypothetical protein [Ignavibacteriales bacterium]